MPEYRRNYTPGGYYFFTVNPVKHGHVSRVRDWPHSSFGRFAENGIYPMDWAGEQHVDDDRSFGEAI